MKGKEIPADTYNSAPSFYAGDEREGGGRIWREGPHLLEMEAGFEEKIEGDVEVESGREGK